MSRGYRLFVLALGLILCGAKPPKEQAKSKPTAQPTQQAAAGSYAPYSGYNPDSCYQAKDHDAADLCAQWRASIAAEKAAHEARRATDWAIVATFLSALSIAAVAWALKLTVDSNGIAKQTLETEKASVAEANRPWLMPQIVRIGKVSDGEFEGGIFFAAEMRNSGVRPTICLYLRADVETSISATDSPPFPQCAVEDHHGYAAPGGIALTSVRPVSKEIVENWKEGKLCLWMRLIAQYSEPGLPGRPYRTEIVYRFDYTGMVLGPDNTLAPNFSAIIHKANAA